MQLYRLLKSLFLLIILLIMKNYKVENFYHKNQFVITDWENTIFQSYNSICAMYDWNTLTLGRDWDYSNTTIRHLYQFLSDYVWLDNLNTKVIRKSIENWKISNWYRDLKLIYDWDLR